MGRVDTEKPIKLPKEAYEQALRQNEKQKKYHLPATYELWSTSDEDDVPTCHHAP